MHRSKLFVAAAALAVAFAVPAFADEPTGIRKEYLASLDDAGGKLQELAGAMPQGKFAWRPMKGVRSTAEVFMHVAGANYGIPAFFGVMPPPSAGIDMAHFQDWEKSTSDKAKVQTLLKDSYAHIHKIISDTPDSDLDTEVNLFGMKMTKRAAFLLIVSHTHEHLGQAIAYARMNKITPPWTAREEAAAKKAAAEKK